MRDVKAGQQDLEELLWYVGARYRGDHCLEDVDMIVIPNPNKALVEDPFGILTEQDLVRFACSNIIKPPETSPPPSVLQSKKIYFVVRENQYCRLIKKILDTNMINIFESSESGFENSFFGI